MRFIEQNSQHPVELLLRVLGIASSTYYEWKKRARQPSDRRVEVRTEISVRPVAVIPKGQPPGRHLSQWNQSGHRVGTAPMLSTRVDIA